MARAIEKLSQIKIQNVSKPGIYGDGDGLWLNVSKSGSKSWVHRYWMDGRAHEMGLGSVRDVGLADARKRNRAARRLRLDGTDPIVAKHAEREAKRLAAASAVTFEVCAQKYIAANRSAWRNAKHAAQWTATLRDYAYPVLGRLSVSAIDVAHVTKVLEPIWNSRSETASRVRGRIELILDYATARRWRVGENPARWRGHLQHILPRPAKVRAAVHHAALPWRSVAVFMAALEQRPDMAALALRFAVLTAARTNEVIGAKWSEIDQQHTVWTVPSARMKAGREHRVPLSDAAMIVLREATKLRTDDASFVFPGAKAGRPMSTMALLSLLRRMGHTATTTHGFRSSFRDWAAETGQPTDIAEAALAHVVGDRTVTAYQRGDLLDRRRKLMEQWATFCARPADATGQVVVLRSA